MNISTRLGTRPAPEGQQAAFVVWGLAGAIALVGWLGWLGWHQPKHRVPGTQDFEGPYEAWQVVAYVATLTAFVAIAAWRGHGPVAARATAFMTTAVFSVEASTDPSPDANIWLAGALWLMIASLAGFFLVSWVVTHLRDTVTSSR